MNQTNTVLKYLDKWLPDSCKGDAENLRKGRLILGSSFLVILFCVSNSIFYMWIDHWIAVGALGFGILAALSVIAILLRTGNDKLAGNTFAASAFLLFSVVSIFTYGIETLFVLWFFISPLSAALMVGIKSGKLWVVFTVAMFLVLFFLDLQGIALPTTFDRKHLPLVNLQSFIGFLAYAAISIIRNEEVKLMTLRQLETSQAETLNKKQELEDINETILQANHDLEEKVRQRTLRLELSNKELDTFLYESSHALRRPVVRLLGLSNVLRIADSEEEQESFLKAIEVTTSGMDKMLSDLLEVSELNSMEINPRDIHLPTFLVHLKESMETSELELLLESEFEEPIYADGFLLGLLLHKLLENALEYRKDHQPKAIVRFSGEQSEEGWHLTIRDEGKGIDPRAVQDVLKMFAKGTQHSTGSGLGLYIAEKATTRMGGNIQLESELGEWTAFKVFLPAAPE